MPTIDLVKSSDFDFRDFVPNPQEQSVAVKAIRSGVSTPLSFSVSDGIPFSTDDGEIDSSMYFCGLGGCGTGETAYISVSDIGLSDAIVVGVTDGVDLGSITIYRNETYSVSIPYFNFVERSENKSKITRAEEIQNWKDSMQIINTLINRCNTANGTSIKNIVLVNQESKNGLLSAEDYDSNMTKIQSSINAIIQASGAQGLNPSNTISLFKRSGQLYPLLIWQRDSNLKTIQTAINAILNMYVWSGA